MLIHERDSLFQPINTLEVERNLSQVGYALHMSELIVLLSRVSPQEQTSLTVMSRRVFVNGENVFVSPLVSEEETKRLGRQAVRNKIVIRCSCWRRSREGTHNDRQMVRRQSVDLLS
jgi:hypothetical protein